MKNKIKAPLSDISKESISRSEEELKKNQELITRKEAIIKTGKYAAYTAMATFIILNPKKAQAQSTPDNPGY